MNIVFGYLAGGLGELLRSPEALLLMLIGMFVGMFVGVLPGLGVVLVASLLLPFIYHLGIVPGIAVMLATLSGGFFSASITAILLNTPGAPESFPTTFDGFPMAENGEAGRALAISATSILVGVLIACVAFIALFQVAEPLTKLFLPPAYVTVIILALVLIGQSGSASVTTTLVSGGIGLMLSFVGSDPVTGVYRFTMGLPGLLSGIALVPFALGLFAVTQMVVMYGGNEAVAKTTSAGLSLQFRSQVPLGVLDVFRNWRDVIRTSLVAVFLGLVPGVGAISANFISYGIGQRTSRRRHLFGTGIAEGIISSESSTLSREVGSLIPAVALGLPSGTGMVLFLAALSILGLQPGPALFQTTPRLPYAMMWIILIAGALSCVLGLALAPWLAKITGVRGPLLFPFIVGLAVIGSYAYQAYTFDVAELLIFSGVGLLMRKLRFSMPAAIMGLILGGTFDNNFHLTEKIYGWNFIVKSPLADIFILLTVLVLLSSLRHYTRTSNKEVVTETIEATIPEVTVEDKTLERAVYGVLLVICGVYSFVAFGYPIAAGLIPAAVAIMVGVISLYQLVLAPTTGLLRQANVAVEGAEIAQDLGPGGSSSKVVVRDYGTAFSSAGSSPLVVEGLSHLTLTESVTSSVRSVKDMNSGARELRGIGWVGVYALGFYILGAKWGIPAATAAYSVFGNRLSTFYRTAIFGVAATSTVIVLSMGFAQLFHLTYGGIL